MPITTKAELAAAGPGISIDLPPAPGGGLVQLSIGYMEVPPGKSIRAHFHDRLEAYIVMSGRAKMLAGEEIRLLEPGDVLVAPLGANHAVETVGDEPLVFYALNSPPAASCPMIDADPAVQQRFDDTAV